MKEAKFVLTIRVTYGKEDGSDLTATELNQLRSNLDFLPQYAAEIGALTDEAWGVVVQEWDHDLQLPEGFLG